MRSLKQFAISLVVVLLALTSCTFSQTSSTSSLRGTVTDPSGSAVAGAMVVLANAESKTERTATTGSQGVYQFLFLPPGTYTLTVGATGFSRYEQTGLELLVNTPATANVQLKIGQATEVITVTAEAPALNLVDASIGNPFNETQVKQIPLEGRSDQSNITLDGVDVNDQSNGYAFTSVLPTTLDSVQEFGVTTSNCNADQGEGSGAQYPS